jgi:hypothetical protein
VSAIDTLELSRIIAQYLRDRDDVAEAVVVKAFNGHAVMVTTQGGQSFQALVQRQGPK